MSNGDEFDSSYKDIYPPELELKKQNNTTPGGSFLDLYLKVNGRLFSNDHLIKEMIFLSQRKEFLHFK